MLWIQKLLQNQSMRWNRISIAQKLKYENIGAINKLLQTIGAPEKICIMKKKNNVKSQKKIGQSKIDFLYHQDVFQ